jgi:hypothetical protein
MVGKIAETDKRSGISDNKLRVPQPDKRNEETDPGGSLMLQAIRNAVDDLLTNTRNREHKKKNA